MPAAQTHSPLPWAYTGRQLLSRGNPICRPMHYAKLDGGVARWQANGELIARAVNCHADMLAFVKAARVTAWSKSHAFAMSGGMTEVEAKIAADDDYEVKLLDALIARAEYKANSVQQPKTVRSSIQ